MPKYEYAVYRFYDVNGVLLYIGCTGSFGMRMKQHGRATPWWTMVATITIEHFDDAATAFCAETLAIRAERPAWNIDDNDVALSGEQPTEQTLNELLAAVPAGVKSMPALMTAEQVADVLPYSPAAVERLARDGFLERHRIPGGGLGFCAESVMHFDHISGIGDSRVREDAYLGLRTRILSARRVLPAA